MGGKHDEKCDSSRCRSAVSSGQHSCFEQALADGSFRADPYPWYDVLRSQAPLYHSESLRQWWATSYDIVEDVLLSTDKFSSVGFDRELVARLPADTIASAPTLARHYSIQGLIQSDPPEHTRMRRAVGSFFTPPAVRKLEDKIEARAHDLIGSLPDVFDLVRDFAAPLPISMVADMIGIPEDERGELPRWSADMNSFPGGVRPHPETALRLDQSLAEFRELLERLLDERRVRPRDDFLTLVTERVRDRSLSSQEATFTCVHLLVAGHETTTGLNSNTVLHMLLRPEVQADVVGDTDLVPALVEEVLRFDPPLHRARRVAKADLNFHGCSIKKGDLVVAMVGAAMRDPGRFEDPERFDVYRQPGRHMAFGRGIHFCLGAPLARLEASLAIKAFVERFPDARLSKGFNLEWAPTVGFRKPMHLRIIGRADTAK